jgi:trimethylamine--corrinoid protein Co-methyltransferase
MKTSVYLYVGPEAMLCNVALKELAAYYGLPDFNTGGCSDAKVLDEQSAYEACFSILQAGLAGSSMVHDVGYLESGLTACWELMVLADEMIEANKYFLKGIAVNRDTLAVDLIHRVGAEGNFLSENHTMRHFKSIWYPKVMNRENYETWKAAGAKRLGQVLNEKVKWILGNHQPEPLAADLKKEIRRILDRAAKSNIRST